MAYTTINDPTQYFNTVLYTGDGTNPRSLTGVGFQPDFTWIKNRTDAWGHGLTDSTRGGGKTLISNSNAVEQTNYTWGYVNSFDSDGFTVTNGGSGDDFVNQTSDNYVSWNWLANGGTTSSNTDGSITSTVQANTTAGFSIVTYTGTGATDEIGHGLGVAPKVIILKSRTTATDWIFYTTIIDGSLDFLRLNTTAAISNSSATAPNSSVFYQATGIENYVAYCFIPIEGYSKFGKYTGNGSSDGTFVYTGFKPAYIVVKRYSTAGSHWITFDNKRETYNVNDNYLVVSDSVAEVTGYDQFDFLSNGFKARIADRSMNTSGANYIYMAFAENPFVTSTSIPVTAR